MIADCCKQVQYHVLKQTFPELVWHNMKSYLYYMSHAETRLCYGHDPGCDENGIFT